jgi:carbonic anhydrase
MSRSASARWLSSVLLGLCAACSSSAPDETAPAPEAGTETAAEPTAEAAPAPAAESAPVHWSYDDATGPAHWGSLTPEYALCAEGHNQSPIDVRNAAGADLPNLELHYAPTPVEIVNNGNAIQVNYAPGSYMQLDGMRYDLAQFHFHSPSEHTVEGKHAAAEMHLVHKAADGQLAVVSVLIDAGVRNSRFDPIWKHLPAQAGPAQRLDQTINVADLLPSDPRTYRYTGSLTTPPGTEGVHWNVMVEPVTVSQAQIDEFRTVMHGNNRPVQELHGRTIHRDTTR